MNSILKKVSTAEEGKLKLDSIISSQGIYRFSDKLFTEHPEVETLSGNGTGAKIISKIVRLLPTVFMDAPEAGTPCVKFLAKPKLVVSSNIFAENIYRTTPTLIHSML